MIDTYILTFDAKNEIKRHKVSALQLLDLLNKFINLLMETKIRKSKYNELYLKYKLYLEVLNNIYQTSPIPSKNAEKKAEEALMEFKTYSQSDIDSFLSPFLKKIKINFSVYQYHLTWISNKYNKVSTYLFNLVFSKCCKKSKPY